jgi:hypothetical protein
MLKGLPTNQVTRFDRCYAQRQEIKKDYGYKPEDLLKTMPATEGNQD